MGGPADYGLGKREVKNSYVELLLEFLEDPSDAKRADLIKSAYEYYCLADDYASGPVGPKFVKNMDAVLTKLVDGDEQEWARLAKDFQYDRSEFVDELMQHSPHHDGLLLFGQVTEDDVEKFVSLLSRNHEEVEGNTVFYITTEDMKSVQILSVEGHRITDMW